MTAITPMLFGDLLPQDGRRSSPPRSGKIFCSLLLIPLVLGLYRVHSIEPENRTHRRKQALRMGLSVQEFRDEERGHIINHFMSPYMRFFARRNLEKECESLSLWQNHERKAKGEPALPIYQRVDIENPLTPCLKLMARIGPKGPNHPYTLIRDKNFEYQLGSEELSSCKAA